MKIILSGNNYKYEIENVVSLFLYEKHEVINSDNIECEGNFVFASKKMVDDKVYLCVKISLNGKTYQDRTSLLADIPNLEKECEFTLARMIYKILAEVTNLVPAWGILTGIRPVKFLREMIAGGVPEDKAKASLKDNYYLTDEKIDLAINTYQNEQKIIEKSDSRSF
ncbi:MAG: hypothetical protein IJC83_03805, partial [Oscillospiraceae bacterium]|nr:hypothetical protein [Oscillospiraceae bacterium]